MKYTNALLFLILTVTVFLRFYQLGAIKTDQIIRLPSGDPIFVWYLYN